jgi:predicted porin
MNKKLIALAVVGACVAPAAMAQTANPVTLYGRAYATFESIEASGGPATATKLTRRNRVEDQSSLLGVRGTEDLGGGLKAFFQLETSFRIDQNTSTFANRNSGVGLQGNWGSVLMGRWDMPFKTANIAIDPFGDLTIGGITTANEDGGNFDRRDQNVVQYWSPTWAGLAVRLAATANEGRTPAVGIVRELNPRDAGASLTYTAGPVYAFYAYEEHKDPSVVITKETGNSVGGSFGFGPITLGALYGEYKRNVATGPGFSKKKSWMANVVWTIGNNQLIYQYQNAKDGARDPAPGVAVTQPECKVNSAGYQYNFSRRTFFLAQYVKVENNATAACNLGGNGGTNFAIAPGQSPKGVSLGLRHVF